MKCYFLYATCKTWAIVVIVTGTSSRRAIKLVIKLWILFVKVICCIHLVSSRKWIAWTYSWLRNRLFTQSIVTRCSCWSWWILILLMFFFELRLISWNLRGEILRLIRIQRKSWLLSLCLKIFVCCKRLCTLYYGSH